MRKRNFSLYFERLNARQMRADRATDRFYSLALIVGLAFAALCIGVVLSLGVE